MSTESRLSTEENAALVFWGQYGFSYINQYLRGFKVSPMKPEHLNPLRAHTAHPASPDALAKWAASQLRGAVRKLPNCAGQWMLWRGMGPVPLADDAGEFFYLEPGFLAASRCKPFAGTTMAVRSSGCYAECTG